MAKSKTKYVYFFGKGTAEGSGNDREQLGGKGAGLAEMTNIGLPVPAGFTITTNCCASYHDNDKEWPRGLEKQVRELDVPAIFTGSVRRVRPYFERATVVVQPSLSETSSLTVLEAGRVGCAVIASAVGGLKELLRDGENGLLVPPGDAAALAAAIDQLLDDERLRDRVSVALHDDTRSFCDPSRSAHEVTAVYESLGPR